MNPYPGHGAGFDGLAIDMADEVACLRSDLSRCDLNNLNAAESIDGSRKQARQRADCASETPRVDDHCIEHAVVGRGRGRDDSPVPPLASVRERHEKRGPRMQRASIERHRVRTCLIAPELARDNRGVAEEAAARSLQQRELFGDVRVEADARDVDEQASVQLAEIDPSIRGVQHLRDRTIWIARDPKHSREPVARSRGDHPECGRPERERRRNFVDGPIAAPRDDDARAAFHGANRELACMPAALSDQELRLDAGC